MFSVSLSIVNDLVTVTQLGDFTKQLTWHAGTSVSKLAFSYDGQQLMGLGKSGRDLYYWDAPTGKLHSKEDLGADAYRALGVYREGLVMAGSRQRIDFCRGAVRLESRKFLRGHDDEILSLSVSPDAKWLVSCGKDRSVRLWKMPGENGEDDGESLSIPSIRCHGADGLSFLGEIAPGNVYYRRCEGELIKVGDDRARRALSFDRNGERFVTWREEGQGMVLEWWTAPGVKLLREEAIVLPFKGLFQVSASGDRGRFAVKAETTLIHFFELDSLKHLGELPVPR